MLPTPTSQSAAEQKKLKREYMKVRQEMNATSSQDEFAKWAKLRRQHDKLYEQLEKSSTFYIYICLWHKAVEEIKLTHHLSQKLPSTQTRRHLTPRSLHYDGSE